jgi:hypothetical protein
VEDIIAVPSVLCVDELVAGGDLFGGGKDCGCVSAGECVSADDQQGELGTLQLLANSVAARCDFA